MDEQLNGLIKSIKSYDKNANFQLIKKSYTYAKKAHEGQKRLSGKDFFVHPLEVAKILIDWKADSASICAALLHDVIEDSSINIGTLSKEFNKEIATIVEGETKLFSTVGAALTAYQEFWRHNYGTIILSYRNLVCCTTR